MLSRFRQAGSLALLIALTTLGMIAQAQAQGGAQRIDNRTRREEILTVITRIDNRAAQFRKTLDDRLDRSYLDGTRAEDNIKQLIRDFDDSRARLRSSVRDREWSGDEVQDLLRRAHQIDNFMVNRRVGGEVLNDWMNVRIELDRLADIYNITPQWRNSGSNTGGVSAGDVRQIISRIETRTDSFQVNLEQQLDRSRLDGTNREDNINEMIREFESATDRLRDSYSGRPQDSRAEAQEVLTRAVRIDNFMTRQRVGGRAADDWQAIRRDLDQLALAFNTTATWGAGGGIGVGSGGNWAANRLTGTFRLDRSQSEDARTAADRATRDLSSGDRQYVYDRLINRLESPDMIAIDRNGRNVTIASTRSPQITFEADGREHVEQAANGASLRVTASLNGDQLSVTTTGNRDTDFNVTFDPIEGGRRLRVTRRLSSDRLNRTVEVQSVYDRTSDVAQWSVYTGGSGYPTTGGASGEWIIPGNTQLLGVLNTNLSTRDSRDGDRFTITVRDPRQYDGAVIEGYVSGVDRGGRIRGRSEMTLNFERIQMRNGRTYSFAGLVQSVRTPNGEVVNVNNEGSVREDNRTSTTATRAAIGTGIGALIGAIAGGAKGAAIGAAIGAGTGAGSVYVQGRDDLYLTSGSEMTILATGPNR